MSNEDFKPTSTPGLVAIFEVEKGQGMVPIVGYLKALTGWDAAVIDANGKVIPVKHLKGFKATSWSEGVLPTGVMGGSLMERFFGKPFP